MMTDCDEELEVHGVFYPFMSKDLKSHQSFVHSNPVSIRTSSAGGHVLVSTQRMFSHTFYSSNIINSHIQTVTVELNDGYSFT